MQQSTVMQSYFTLPPTYQKRPTSFTIQLVMLEITVVDLTSMNWVHGRCFSVNVVDVNVDVNVNVHDHDEENTNISVSVSVTRGYLGLYRGSYSSLPTWEYTWFWKIPETCIRVPISTASKQIIRPRHLKIRLLSDHMSTKNLTKIGP